MNSAYSKWNEISSGVPQGSILGHDLQNIYSNDLFYILILYLINFADDNSPFCCKEDNTSVLDQLSYDSETILNWICDNELKANPDKFDLLLSEIY